MLMKTMTIKFFHKHAERTVKAFLIFLSVTTLTCCEKPASLENEDYFLKTEITDVGKGCFTVNFDCGEDVATIKYAIGYAVDMYKDSISFKENKLADIIEITPENGKVSVPFDFTEPFDFGPFTIYARSVTASGNESPVIKTQVCALPAGLTIEYLSRARLDMRTSYHGNETVVFINSVHQQTIDEDYGGDIDNYIGIIKEIVVRNGYCDYPIEKDKKVTFRNTEKQYVIFFTYNGTDIDSYFFHTEQPEVNPDILLPSPLTIDEFVPVTTLYPDEGITYTMESNVTMGSNTDLYANVFTYEETLNIIIEEARLQFPDFYGNMTDEEIIISLISFTGPLALGDNNSNFTYEDGHIGLFVGDSASEDNYGETFVLVACPINWNWEPGKLQIVSFDVPQKEEFPEPVPAGIKRNSAGKGHNALFHNATQNFSAKPGTVTSIEQ